MAKKKNMSSRNTRKGNAFPEVRGKVVERVEISTRLDDCAIGILFQDRTYLSFDLESEISIRPELSDWKTGNYKPLKRWPPLRQRLT